MNNTISKTGSLFLGFALLASLPACSDFLETEPYDFAAPETFYSNESECTMALAGIYYTLVYEETYGNYYSCMISNVDDLSYYQRNVGSINSQVYGNGHSPSNQHIWGAWEKFYKGINNANLLLQNIDDANISEPTKSRIKGEAKFLRAYYHFLLVQGWYEVPIRKFTISDINDSDLEATPHTEALDWIIDEMEGCVDLVDDSDYDSSPSHVKKNTVMGILARVYLWRAGYPSNGGQPDYEKAAYWANQVKESGKHHLNPDVYALWKNMAADKYDATYNESIWEAEFVGYREGNDWTCGRIGNVIGNIQTGTTDGYGYGFYAGSLILWDLFDDNDARRDLSMAPYSINANNVKKDWSKTQFVQRACGKFRREWETDPSKSKSYTPENYPILRYADVLLMLAEAENEAHQGPTALAYACINEVRSRAGIESLSNETYDSFQQLVRDERGRELCFESLRKYDLVRWGIYVKAVHDDLGQATADSRWAPADKFQGAKSYAAMTEAKHQFLPIPTKELNVNTKLVQNSYWR